MKRIATFLLAAGMVLGAGSAQAIDVKVKGTFDFAYGVADNLGFHGENSNKRNDDDTYAEQRIRTQINFVASEYLQGVLMFEIGDNFWGSDTDSHTGRGSGGALDTDGVNIETKHAYLDFLVPNTDLSVRMGMQYLALPMGTGYNNPVFGADVAGVVASYKFNDMFSATAFWARPFDNYRNDDESGSSDQHYDDEVDMFGLVLPVNGDGWSATPWGVVANVGSASGMYEYLTGYGYGGGAKAPQISEDNYEQNGSATAWWAGGAFNVSMFNPLTFGFDVMYGNLGRNEFKDTDGSEFGIESKGWFVDAKLDYKLGWATPGAFGWWSSGDKADDVKDGKYGRIPTLGMDDGFNPLSFGAPGSIYGVDTAISETMVGTWGVGLQLADMSFIKDLSHTIRVAYYQGTNQADVARDGNDLGISGENVYMTDKDHAWEVDFDHTYQIYENLTAYLELGYINLSMDEDVWGSDQYSNDAFRGQVGFSYSF